SWRAARFPQGREHCARARSGTLFLRGSFPIQDCRRDRARADRQSVSLTRTRKQDTKNAKNPKNTKILGFPDLLRVLRALRVDFLRVLESDKRPYNPPVIVRRFFE